MKRRIFNISLFALLAMVFVGCENGEVLGENNGNSVDVEIPVDADYITFMTDVRSRATLVTSDYIEDSFGVISYTYDSSNSWGAYKVHAKPNADALGEGQKYPTEVLHDAGTYSYGTAVAWNSAMKYAFFAYAPYAPYGSNGAVKPSGTDVEGTPYVTYTLDTGDATKHADVITGYAANCSASVSKYVQFRMNHRLAAVDVAAVNYYDYTYPSGTTDSDGDPIYMTEKVTVEIEEMTATFTNLQYGSAKIYLDRSIDTEPVKLGSTTKPQYPIVGKDGYELGYSTSSAFDYISVDQGTTMLFIPQIDDPANDSDNLTVDIEVKYKKKRPDGTYLWTVVETVEEETENGEKVQKEYRVDIPAGSTEAYIKTIDPNNTVKGTIRVDGKDTDGVFTTTQRATFDQDLKEEYRYYALLTFTSHAVSINILTAAAWDEHPVDYEFD